jgi:YgiT-type zinc finger domain-containing protein
MCKGTLANHFSTFMADLENCIVIVKNVPSQVCSQCGEVSYSNEVARQLEQIVRHVKETLNTEVAVVNYSDKAA